MRGTFEHLGIERIYGKFLVGIAFFLGFTCTAIEAFSQEAIFFRYDITNGLPTNTIYQIQEDSLGRIWIGHDKGISVFNGIEFKNFECKEFSDPYIIRLKLGPDNKMYFINYSGQFGYVSNDSTIKVDLPSEINSIHDILIKEKQMFFYAFGEMGEVRFFQARIKDFVESGSAETIYSDTIYNRSDINFMVEGDQLLYRKSSDLVKANWVTGSKSVEEMFFRADFSRFRSFPEGNTRHYIIGRDNQILKIDIDGHILEEKEVSAPVYYAIERRDKGLVFAQRNGLVSILRDVKEEVIIKVNLPSRIFEDSKNRIWIGTEGEGLVCIPHLEAVKKAINLSKRKEMKRDYRSNAYKLSFSKDQKWLRIEDKNERKKISFSAKGFKKYIIARDTIYVSSSSGYFEIPLDSLSFENNAQRMITQFPRLISEQSFSFIWDKGCNYICHLSGVTQVCGSRLKRIDSLNGVFGKEMEIMDDKLIILDNQGRLIVYDLQSEEKKNLNNVERIRGIRQIDSVVFALGEQNIYTLDPNSKLRLHALSQYYKELNGVVNIEYKNGSYVLYDNKDEYNIPAGSLEHLPNSFIGLIGASIGDRSFNEEHIEVLKGKRDEDFCFQYETINYTSSHQGVYYTLSKIGESQNDKVIRYSGNNTLCFSNLYPGEYNIEASMYRDFSVSSEQKFLVQPYFVEQTSFLVSTAAGTAFLFSWLIYQWRALRKKRATEKKELLITLDSLNLRLLQNQLNPHYLFNLLSSIKARVMQNHVKEALSLVNRMIEHLRSYFEYTDSSTIKLSEEVEFLKSYVELESNERKEPIDFEVNLRGFEDKEGLETKIPTMILQPLVENAIKHSNQKKAERLKIDLLLVNSTEGIQCTVSNSTREKNKNVKVNGNQRRVSSLELIERRLSIINGEKTKVEHRVIRSHIDSRPIEYQVALNIKKQ